MLHRMMMMGVTRSSRHLSAHGLLLCSWLFYYCCAVGWLVAHFAFGVVVPPAAAAAAAALVRFQLDLRADRLEPQLRLHQL